MSDKRAPGRDQRDVLKGKDNVTRNDRGLQVWGDEPMGASGQAGDGGQGTAERNAVLTKAQEADADEEKTP